MPNYDYISTEDLLNRLEDPVVQIIDIRPVESYNGWKKFNEKRGGHIKNARSLPLKWTNYIDWLDIVQSKNIEPEHELIIYSYSKLESEKVAQKFSRAGYPNIKIFDGFVNEWSSSDTLPMDYLPRYKNLVSAEWLKELIEKGTAPEYDNNRFVICHGHYRNQEDYEIGHIPSAISLDTLLLESPITWNRRTPEELKTALEKLGITHDATVILYGRFSFPDNDDPFPGSSAGHLGSIRCAFIMLYAGVKDVRVLNGGIQSWQDAGYELSTEIEIPEPVQDFGVEIPANPEYVTDISQAKEILASNKANLVSIRSWSEFIGEVSGYNYIEKKGRIPGAVFGNCGSDAYHMENYRNLDHTMREYHEIINLWEEVGITPDKQNAYYCGTGWRGSEAFWTGFLMNWPKISVFDGGWFEWSNDNSNPYETGDPNTNDTKFR
ncbi:MAG: rhodanese-like domain-containing protein [Candidatus Hodarchaeales archaeon]